MRRYRTLALIFALGGIISCSDDTRSGPWDLDESAADAELDTGPDAPLDADVGARSDSGDGGDVPVIEPPGCAESEQSFVVSDNPAMLEGYWSTGEAIGNCIHAVHWLEFGAANAYEQVTVDGDYCYEGSRGVHRCAGSWDIEKSSGNLYESCQLEPDPATRRFPFRPQAKGSWAIHKEAGRAARLTRMAFRRTAERDGPRREWGRTYSEVKPYGDGEDLSIKLVVRLAIEESALAAAADGEVQTDIILQVDATAHRVSGNEPTGGTESLRRELDATIEPIEGDLLRLTVDLGYADTYESARWHNYLGHQPEFQEASDHIKSAFIEAFHPVLYFDAANPRIGAGHPPRQSWRAICDPCESYAESFPEEMAEMCE